MVFEDRPNGHWTDVMVDLETTGTQPDLHGIVQIAAVKFNLVMREVCPIVFDWAVELPYGRSWEEGTRDWWLRDEGRRNHYGELAKRMKPAEEVLDHLVNWLGGHPMVFWSKPTHFDFMFMQSYFKQFGRKMPFHYRTANDLNSFLRGLSHPNKPAFNEYNVEVPGNGMAHDAAHDNLVQIQMLFKNLDAREDEKRAQSTGLA